MNRFVLVMEKYEDNVLLKSEAFDGSTAGLLVAKKLAFPVNTLYPLIYIPKGIRDWFYDIVAKNRYK